MLELWRFTEDIHTHELSQAQNSIDSLSQSLQGIKDKLFKCNSISDIYRLQYNLNLDQYEYANHRKNMSNNTYSNLKRIDDSICEFDKISPERIGLIPLDQQSREIMLK